VFETEPTVFVVDDDVSFRRSVERLVRLAGFKVQTFGSARNFLASRPAAAPSCLVSDVRMPGLSGLDLQRELARAGWQIPIIFITGHGDIPMSVQAMKAGAVEFLTKPFRNQELLGAIQRCLEQDSAAREKRTQMASLSRRYQELTLREREVMALFVAGLRNKQIAGELGIKEITVKVHRAQVMAKMQAASLAALVRMAEQLDVSRSTIPQTEPEC
jgi:FixJ family two-component response regulator